MKTKIIYISGNEIFDMNDIRAAFNQVRAALALDSDTVLFGVPVDKADALSTDVSNIADVAPTVAIPAVEIPTAEIHEPVVTDIPTETISVIEDKITDIVADTPDTIETAAPQKKSRGRQKSAKKVAAEVAAPADTTIAPHDENKVVSILSVLKSDVAQDTDTKATIDTDVIDIPEPETVTKIEEPEFIEDVDTTPVTEFNPISDELPPDDDIATDDIQDASVEDMIANDAPIATPTQEKTLEQLLESMIPLREDIEFEHHDAVADNMDDTDSDTTDDTIDISTDDDATLEQLATEFAESQDKITTAPKTENQGKIGKLKNILPFKKVRRDDSGLMGDLFGWAGIAANDEEFAIPGFFTNAASKK